MLGYADRDLFGLLHRRPQNTVVHACPSGTLRIIFEPSPLVGIRPAHPRPGITEGKAVYQSFHQGMGYLGLIPEQERFTLILEPVLIIFTILIKGIVYILGCCRSVGVYHKCQFRAFHAQSLPPVHLAHQHFYPRGIMITVGSIQEEKVYSCIDQHLHVLGHDVFVSCRVVSQPGLTPPMEGLLGSPIGIIGIFLEKFRHIFSCHRMHSVPDVIKHADCAVLVDTAACHTLIGLGYISPQFVNSHPCIGICLPCLGFQR